MAKAPKTRKAIRVVPSAARLIGSLRDLGYQTSEAVADLVDNSISAKAKAVDITIGWHGPDSWIRIADDGIGMTGSEITEAMRYGASRKYEEEDLGKFGLGLKTASLSQCRCLTVASRTQKSGRMEVRQLDLDHIEERNDWEVLQLAASQRPDQLEILDGRGTVVLWEDLDRILTYDDPGGGWAERRLKEIAQQLDEHLGMVFHKFLQGEVRGQKLEIRINDTKVQPWDPFARDEPKTKPLQTRSYSISTPYGSGIVDVQPYILPPKSSFSSLTAWTRMSGPRDWNNHQGLYIYRANRLIQAGTWSRLRAIDEHTKLARVALSFPTSLDAAFGINVAKMRVTLPPELKDVIKTDISNIAVSARKVYDAKPDSPKASAKPNRPASHGVDQQPIAASAPVPITNSQPADMPAVGPSAPIVEAKPTHRRVALEGAAKAVSEREALDRIIGALRERDQQIARELGFD